MWYENNYRRHLLDMHIDDWDESFLSAFSPEEYFKNLKRAKIQSAMIYFQSHVGYCYYPTKTGKMHRAFIGKEDAIKRLVDMCRSGGIEIVGYYSLNYNTWAHDNYPSWRMLTESGRSRREEDSDDFVNSCTDAKAGRYGLCCPNNMDYRKFVFAQMAEMNDYFDFDGMFFDMLFWPHFCYCESCQKRFKAEVGAELPKTEDWSNSLWRTHVDKRREWMGEWAQAVTDEMKRLRPGIPVEHNMSAAVGAWWQACCSESVNEACDYTGGDLYGDKYNQSYTCKFYRNLTKNQPFEYMFSRCEPNLSKHTITKSDDNIRSSVFITAAHHGATLVIDAIDPVGTMDSRVYDKIGKVFEVEEKYEPHFMGEMIEDIGLYASMKSKYGEHGGYSNTNGCVCTTKTLINNNILWGVTGGYHSLSGYKALIAPMLTSYDEYDNERLIKYVEEGGTLYFSGGDNKSLTEKLLGTKVLGVTDETVTYIAPERDDDRFLYFNKKYPLPFEGCGAKIQECEGTVATIKLPYTKQNDLKFASIHSNPPGIDTEYPAVVIKPYGKGRVIWCAMPIEAEGGEEYRRILMNLISCTQLSILSDAPRRVEITGFREKSAVTVNAVYLSDEYDAPKIDPFEIKLLSDKPPKSVTLLPDNENFDFRYENGYVCFKTRKLDIFDMYKIELEG